jgi:predicted TIM-barrel fold metal-dependent hydrolase
MASPIFDEIRIIDTDTHVSEPEDLWTSRVSTQKWGDLVPHVRRDDERGIDVWWWAGEPSLPTGLMSAAGWPEFTPAHPPTLAAGDPGCFDPKARLERMDADGIFAQVLYPNLGGFGSGKFIALRDPELQLACVRAYNDFLVDWIQVDPTRFLPITALPFWDLEASIAEASRCAKLGHKGILMTGEPENFDQPYLADPYWDPLWACAQDLGLPINFHIGNSATELAPAPGYAGTGEITHYAKLAVSAFMANSRHIIEVITSGICHRFPRLDFVSVESGIGWLPFLLEALDWQWGSYGVWRERPELDLLPSEYFRRQIYACFWFEEQSALSVIDQFADNILYETDYPHPTSMSPGPASIARAPRDYLRETFGELSDATLVKVLHDNAARVYHFDESD